MRLEGIEARFGIEAAAVTQLGKRTLRIAGIFRVFTTIVLFLDEPVKIVIRIAAAPVAGRQAFLFYAISQMLDSLSRGRYNAERDTAGRRIGTMTAKGNTKQEILEAALELFSTQGYEATSTAQLAEAVGIRKASLYSHFESKQAILDALLQTASEQYELHSIFANADWDDPDFTKDKENLTPEAAVQMFVGQIRYILHDPQISRARRMLTIEQFQNAQMAAMQTKRNYTDVVRYFQGLVRFLIRRGRLADRDPEIMAAQLCLPISVWINLCDREPERESDVMKLIERHVRQFFELYRAEETAI